MWFPCVTDMAYDYQHCLIKYLRTVVSLPRDTLHRPICVSRRRRRRRPALGVPHPRDTESGQLSRVSCRCFRQISLLFHRFTLLLFLASLSGRGRRLEILGDLPVHFGRGTREEGRTTDVELDGGLLASPRGQDYLGHPRASLMCNLLLKNRSPESPPTCENLKICRLVILLSFPATSNLIRCSGHF